MCSSCSTTPMLDKAVEVGPPRRLNIAGQASNAAKRVLVHEKIADRFLASSRQRSPA